MTAMTAAMLATVLTFALTGIGISALVLRRDDRLPHVRPHPVVRDLEAQKAQYEQIVDCGLLPEWNEWFGWMAAPHHVTTAATSRPKPGTRIER